MSSSADNATDERERDIQNQLMAFLASERAAELRQAGVCINAMGPAVDLATGDFYADVRVFSGSPLSPNEIESGLGFSFDVRVSEDIFEQQGA